MFGSTGTLDGKWVLLNKPALRRASAPALGLRRLSQSYRLCFHFSSQHHSAASYFTSISGDLPSFQGDQGLIACFGYTSIHLSKYFTS